MIKADPTANIKNKKLFVRIEQTFYKMGYRAKF
jgi:hypothetical protein